MCTPCERGFVKETNGSAECEYVYSSITNETMAGITESVSTATALVIGSAVTTTIGWTLVSSHESCLMSHESCLMSHVLCLMSHVSRGLLSLHTPARKCI